jgi:hypothetical protein
MNFIYLFLLVARACDHALAPCARTRENTSCRDFCAYFIDEGCSLISYKTVHTSVLAAGGGGDQGAAGGWRTGERLRLASRARAAGAAKWSGAIAERKRSASGLERNEATAKRERSGAGRSGAERSEGERSGANVNPSIFLTQPALFRLSRNVSTGFCDACCMRDHARSRVLFPTRPTDPTDRSDRPTRSTDRSDRPTDRPTDPTDRPTRPTDRPDRPTDRPTPADSTDPTDRPTRSIP